MSVDANPSSPFYGCGRFVHQKHLDPVAQNIAYDQGKLQASISLDRYHELRAAIEGLYDLVDNIPPDPSRGQIFPRQGLSFERYTLRPLKPISGIKLHPRPDGTIHPNDIEMYVGVYQNNWKCRESGLLYWVAEHREFWNMVLNWHSSAHTTGYAPFDEMFDRLKAGGFEMGILQCQFFAREIGCLDAECPFLHDKEASMRIRDEILADRRKVLREPLPRILAARERKVYASPGRERSDEEYEKVSQETENVVQVCHNSACLVANMKPGTKVETESIQMFQCSRCTIATYCSQKCQAADWKAHKKQPCRPFEDIVADDELWNFFGLLKGTSWIPIQGE